jgi:hypothetical protein
MTREQIEQRWRNGGMSYVEYVDALNALALDEFVEASVPPCGEEEDDAG